MTSLKGIQARVDAATPGPWYLLDGTLRPQLPATRIVEVIGQGKTPIVAWPGFDDSDRPFKKHQANAEFIAHARSDILYLLRRLEAAEVVIAMGSGTGKAKFAAIESWEKAKEEA